MFGKKKVEAVLESKAIVENNNAPLMDGNRGILFVYAEKSGSFFSKDILYTITFRIGNKRKEFRVNKVIYESLVEGTKGLLVYDGSVFENFTVLEDESHEK